MSLPCTGNRESARKRAAVRSKAETGSKTGATGEHCHNVASNECPVLVPLLQDNVQVQTARFRAGTDVSRFTGAPNETRGNAREENEQMRKSGRDAKNAETDIPSVANVQDLRLTALLFDLVEARGKRGAAKALGVSYVALARAADTGRLTGRMREAQARRQRRKLRRPPPHSRMTSRRVERDNVENPSGTGTCCDAPTFHGSDFSDI